MREAGGRKQGHLALRLEDDARVAEVGVGPVEDVHVGELRHCDAEESLGLPLPVILEQEAVHAPHLHGHQEAIAVETCRLR